MSASLRSDLWLILPQLRLYARAGFSRSAERRCKVCCQIAPRPLLIAPGFARRYFTLYQNGLLVYAFEPGQPVRDHLFLQTAAIATTPGRRDIHVDSEATTFHIKCLSSDDFNRWMGTFRYVLSAGTGPCSYTHTQQVHPDEPRSHTDDHSQACDPPN